MEFYHGGHAKDVTVVLQRLVIFGDVREVGHVVGVLTRAVDVANFVFANRFLPITVASLAHIHRQMKKNTTHNLGLDMAQLREINQKLTNNSG